MDGAFHNAHAPTHPATMPGMHRRRRRRRQTDMEMKSAAEIIAPTSVGCLQKETEHMAVPEEHLNARGECACA